MQNIYLWIGIIVAVLLGLWKVFKTYAKATPTTKDDEIVAKVDPYVQKGEELVNEFVRPAAPTPQTK